jgi:hypothetical protein
VAPSVAWTTFIADVSGIADTTLTLTGLTNNKVHNWRVQSTNSYGTSSWSAPFAFKTVAATSVLDAEHNPAGFGLAQNYPNPFNPRTTISFTLDRPSEVELAVYDLLGRRIALLMSGEHQLGTYEAFFNGSNLPTGIYFYRLVAQGRVETRKMLLLK